MCGSNTTRQPVVRHLRNLIRLFFAEPRIRRDHADDGIGARGKPQGHLPGHTTHHLQAISKLALATHFDRAQAQADRAQTSNDLTCTGIDDVSDRTDGDKRTDGRIATQFPACATNPGFHRSPKTKHLAYGGPCPRPGVTLLRGFP